MKWESKYNMFENIVCQMAAIFSRPQVLTCNFVKQRCCRGAFQISEPLEKSKPTSRGFETSRDLAITRLPA